MTEIFQETLMGFKSFVYLVRRISPFDSAIKAFSVLPENDDINLRFFNDTAGSAADKVQRIAYIRFTGTDTDIQE
jgi:hypothetical protein